MAHSSDARRLFNTCDYVVQDVKPLQTQPKEMILIEKGKIISAHAHSAGSADGKQTEPQGAGPGPANQQQGAGR